MDFLTMSTEERATHFAGLSNEDLATAHAALTASLDKAFAIKTSDLTLEQANKTEVEFAARKQIKAEQDSRAAAAAAASEKFAAMRAEFSEAPVNDGVESGVEGDEPGTEGDQPGAEGDEPGDEDESEPGTEGEEGVEAATGDNPFMSEADKKKKQEEGAMTASAAARGATKVPAARKAAAANKPPERRSSPEVVITAASDVQGFATGQRLGGMNEVTKAVLARVKGFPKFNLKAAEQVRAQNGGKEALVPFGAASFGVPVGEAMVASGTPGQEHRALQASIKRHTEVLRASMDGVGAARKTDKDSLVAAGYCAPSEVSYNYLADYNIWGLDQTPEVSAPRGGLMTTTGPALAEQYAEDGSDFGWRLTETQMEAGVLKTCETIVCPEFEDHRVDAVGYCWKIPILTEKFYPELIEDAMRLSAVLYAHKMNARRIADKMALSDLVTATGLGATFTDTLEALAILAHKERRRLNLSENAIMEVDMPTWAIEVFRAEVSRRPFRMASGPVSDAEINQEFVVRNLAPKYLTDFFPLTGANPVFPSTFPVMVYPAGTFANVMDDVINLSAVYDAASLVKNEYTGVFYEQSTMLFKVGYKSTKFTIPICTAGLVGAPVLDCHSESTNFAGQKQTVVA